MYTVIMTGGKGTRFWPLSTEDRPKQLLSLVGNTSLLQQAVDRISHVLRRDTVTSILERQAIHRIIFKPSRSVNLLRNRTGKPQRSTLKVESISGIVVCLCGGLTSFSLLSKPISLPFIRG